MIDLLKQQQLTNLLPVGIYSTDTNGLITYYNEKAVEIWGRRPRLNDPLELPFCGALKLYDKNGNLLPHAACHVATALKHGTSVRNTEVCIERADGSRVAALVNIDLIPGDGSPSGAISTIYGLTQKENPHFNNRWLESIVELSEDAIISKTLDGTVTSWNKAAEKIFGYSKEEVIGRSIFLIIPPSRIAEEVEILSKIKLGEKVEHFETSRVTKDGRLIHISLSVSPVKDQNGRIVGASKISRDITEKVRMNERLAEFNRKLAALNKAKDEFIALASHELKTPTTTIKGYLQIIEEEIEKEEYKTYIKKTLRQVDKLTALISDMLDVTTLQNGNLKLNFSSFDVHQLAQECASRMRYEGKHDIEVKNNSSSPCFVNADKNRIAQVINTVLTNAIKYSPQAGKVIVNTQCGPEFATISIQDFGPGIPGDKLEQIFARFYRVNRTDFSSGLGIGLYIAREIITGHRGRIWVESVEGSGATFFIQLPIAPERIAGTGSVTE